LRFTEEVQWLYARSFSAGGQSPLWVNRAVLTLCQPLPVCPYEQILTDRPGMSENSPASFVRQKERSFTLFLVHRIIPKAVELFLDHPADTLPA
jgi:hypothetical protein